MPFTRDQVEQIPPVYRDFLLLFGDFTDEDEPRITGFRATPLNRVFNALATNWGLAPDHVRKMAKELRDRQLIVKTPLPGYYEITPRGEELVRAIADLEEHEDEPFVVPEFPNL